ncbi:MAG: hypothetical protein MR671_05360 [Clostridiales bacterium]|nr:hypothetical protein [Clostridiales bacterium]
MLFGMTYYQICAYFLIYSFAGWIVEVMFFAVSLGKVVNRGFLNGPVCPVYGFGMLAVLSAGHAAEGAASRLGFSFTMQSGGWTDTLLLFLGGMLLTTLVELAAGWALDHLFHARWWDYRDRPLNFHGYICLEFSIIWGIAVVIVVRVLHPLISRQTVSVVPETCGWPIMAVLYALYLADLILTVLTVVGFNRKLAELNRLRASIRSISDKLSATIADTTISTAQHVQNGQVQAALGRAELRDAVQEKSEQMAAGFNTRKEAVAAEFSARKDSVASGLAAQRDALTESYRAARQKLTEATHFGSGRLMKAFPNMVHEQYDDLLKEVEAQLNRYTKKRRNRGHNAPDAGKNDRPQ